MNILLSKRIKEIQSIDGNNWLEENFKFLFFEFRFWKHNLFFSLDTYTKYTLITNVTKN
jgi:hypothetical protein